jgi:hypothetical protein
VLARDTIRQEGPEAPAAAPPQPDVWVAPINALKAESAWFKQEALRVFELITLPVLQLFAAAMNFAAVALGSRGVFALPFKNIEEVRIKTPLLSTAGRATNESRAPAERPQTTQEGGTAQ